MKYSLNTKNVTTLNALSSYDYFGASARLEIRKACALPNLCILKKRLWWLIRAVILLKLNLFFECLIYYIICNVTFHLIWNRIASPYFLRMKKARQACAARGGYIDRLEGWWKHIDEPIAAERVQSGLLKFSCATAKKRVSQEWVSQRQLRVLVLTSLFIQCFLFFSDNLRKCSAPPGFRFLMWPAYLGNDAASHTLQPQLAWSRAGCPRMRERGATLEACIVGAHPLDKPWRAGCHHRL
jgi:hypothetical protein